MQQLRAHNFARRSITSRLCTSCSSAGKCAANATDPFACNTCSFADGGATNANTLQPRLVCAQVAISPADAPQAQLLRSYNFATLTFLQNLLTN